MAKLYFRYSAMNAGKSTALLQVAHNYEERNMKVLILKPGVDKKGEDKVVSRLSVERKVDYIIDDNYNIENIELKDISCILVDEAQFLNKEQINQLFNIAVIKDIPVLCYGIRTDFKGEGFEGSIRLLEIAHEIEEMKTICRCGKKAILNIRYVDEVPVFDGNQVVIDNDSKIEYESVCGKCFIEKKGGL